MEEKKENIIELSDIPIEIISMILNEIDDNKSLCYSRLVCQQWKTLLNNRWINRKPLLKKHAHLIFGSEGNKEGQFQNPSGIVINKKGNIYVVDRNNHRIQVFNCEGQFLFTWGIRGSGDGQFNYQQHIHFLYYPK